MDRDDFWTTVRNKDEAGNSRSGAITAAVLFSAVVIAAALIAAPLLGSREDRAIAERHLGDFDTLVTGSIPAGTRTYTVRRSITQPMPDALCIIDSAGNRRGAC